MRFAMTVTFSVVLSLGPAPLSNGQSSRGGMLRGMVSLSGGVASPASVHVQIQKLGMTVQETFISNGRFEFWNVPAGRYILVADAPGYETAETAIDLPAESFTMIQLRAIRKPRPRANTPSVAPALQMGSTYFKQGKLDEAERAFTTATRKDPSEGNGYFGLGMVRLEQNRLDEAAQLGQKAHASSRHGADVHLMLAKIYQRQGKTAAAREELEWYSKEARPGRERDRVREFLSKPKQGAGAP